MFNHFSFLCFWLSLVTLITVLFYKVLYFSKFSFLIVSSHIYDFKYASCPLSEGHENWLLRKKTSRCQRQIQGLLRWMTKIAPPSTKTVKKSWKWREIPRRGLRMLMFAKSVEPILKENRTKKVLLVLQAYLAVMTNHDYKTVSAVFVRVYTKNFPSHVSQLLSVLAVDNDIVCMDAVHSVEGDEAVDV